MRKPHRATYIIAKEVATPYVVNTTMPHKPTIVRYKRFKQGDMISGDVHYTKDGKPDFVLVKGKLVVPISCVKELVTKEVLSNVDGKGKTTADFEKYVKTGNPKVKYLDAAIIGAIIGFGATWLAEKKGWISTPDKKNKLIGAGVVATLFGYVVYRFRNSKKKK